MFTGIPHGIRHEVHSCHQELLLQAGVARHPVQLLQQLHDGGAQLVMLLQSDTSACQMLLHRL